MSDALDPPPADPQPSSSDAGDRPDDGGAGVAPAGSPAARPPVRPGGLGGPELEVDLAAFLPEGAYLAASTAGPGPATEAGSVPPGEDHVVEDHAVEDHVVEELVYEEADGEVGLDPVVDEPLAPAPAAGTAPAEGPAAEPVDLSALTRIEADLDAVDRALAALDDGSYGACAVCGGQVDEGLLAADPVRRTCAAHAGQAASTA